MVKSPRRKHLCPTCEREMILKYHINGVRSKELLKRGGAMKVIFNAEYYCPICEYKEKDRAWEC